MVDFNNQTLQVNNEDVTFYGLYNQGIPRRSWLNDDKTLLLSTPQGGSIHSFAIDTGNIYSCFIHKNAEVPFINCIHFIESKVIRYLPVTKPFHESVSVLDVCNDYIVCYKSSLNKPGQLFVVKVNFANNVYDFSNIAIYEVSPSRSLPNSDEFIVEHGYTLYSKF